jgi:hypothetical protein
MSTDGKQLHATLDEWDAPRRGFMPHLTDQDVRNLIASYSEEQLRENYAIAAQHPGTIWHQQLGQEVRRRGLAECRSCEELYPTAALCPDGYHFDCCDAAEHNHEPVPSDTGDQQ